MLTDWRQREREHPLSTAVLRRSRVTPAAATSPLSDAGTRLIIRDARHASQRHADLEFRTPRGMSQHTRVQARPNCLPAGQLLAAAAAGSVVTL
ncbi:hypothetical protein GCM10010442_34860 [Kitasatospora kifunensis]